MTDPIRLAQHTTVGACQALLRIEPLLVPLEADLLDVLRRASRQPATRLIGVVDGDGRLVGVIPVTKVAESIVARAVPEALLIDVDDSASAARFSHSVADRLASDVMLPPATTVPSATIGAAFRSMHSLGLGGLYIVDPSGRPIGYLDLLELAIVYVAPLEEARTGGATGTRAQLADPRDPARGEVDGGDIDRTAGGATGPAA